MTIFTCTYAMNYNAGPKAQFDIIKILKKYSKGKINEKTIILSPNNSLHDKVLNIIKKIIAFFKIKLINDFFIIQYPLGSNIKMLKRIVNKNTILLIHDIMGLRFEDKEVLNNEIDVFKKAKIIIVHNKKMQEYLKALGIENKKMINLELFDYLMNDSKKRKETDLKKVLTIAYVGNLAPEKCPFISMLDKNKMNFNIYLYGKGNTKNFNDKIIYKGSFLPDDLPGYIEGNMGLVWDGNIDDEITNNFMNYSKYNNPHKLSCYIAAELPVVVWEKSAIASLVKKYNIGYTINNLYDINNLNLKEYNEKKQNVIMLSKKVRSGYFSINAYEELLKRI